MEVAALIADYDANVAPFALHGSCKSGCYSEYGSLAELVEKRQNYFACVVIDPEALVDVEDEPTAASSRPRVHHRVLPVMIGSNLDMSIRTERSDVEDQRGYFIILGQVHLLNCKLGNNTRSIFTFRLAKPCKLFNEPVTRMVKIPFMSTFAETVQINYSSVADEFVVTSSHMAAMRGLKQNSPLASRAKGLSKDAFRKLKYDRKEVVENFNLMAFLQQHNDVHKDFTLQEMKDFLKDLELNGVRDIDSLAGNKTMSTPGSNLRDVVYQYIVQLNPDTKRLFEEGVAYTPLYDGHRLDRKVITRSPNLNTLRSRMESGLFQEVLSRPRRPMLDLLGHAIPCHSKPSQPVGEESSYDALSGQRHGIIEDCSRRCKRVRGNVKTNVREASYPKDAAFFICPAGTKEMKKAGATVDLAHGVVVAIETPMTQFVEFIRKWNEPEGRFVITIDWKLTGVRVQDLTTFLRSVKEIFPMACYRLLETHVMFHLAGGMLVKWSPSWNMFVCPAEAYNDRTRRLFGVDPFAGLPYHSRFGPHMMSASMNAENIAPSKLPVVVNAVRGAVPKPNEATMQTCAAYPGFNLLMSDPPTRDGCTSSFTSMDIEFNTWEKTDFLDLTEHAIRLPETEREHKLVKKVQDRFWSKIQAERGGEPRPLLANRDNPNLCGLNEVDMCGSLEVVEARRRAMARAAALLLNQPVYWGGQLPVCEKDEETVEITVLRDIPGISAKRLARHPLSAIDDCLARDPTKRRNAPTLIMTYAFADVCGYTNEDAIVMDSSLKTKTMMVFVQNVKINCKNKADRARMHQVKWKQWINFVNSTVVFGRIEAPFPLIVKRKASIRQHVTKRGSGRYFYLLSYENPAIVESHGWTVKTRMMPQAAPKSLKKDEDVQLCIRLSMHGHRPLGIGNKLSTLHGQKGIVTHLHDFSKDERFLGVTEDGCIIYPQLIFTPTSVQARSQSAQWTNGHNSPVGLRKDGGHIGCLAILLSSICPEKGHKTGHPKLDLMTNQNGFAANNLAMTERHLCNVKDSVRDYAIKQFILNGGVITAWGDTTPDLPI